MAIGLRKIIKLFDRANICVFGERGDGKDMLIGNVVVRRRLPYCSNVDYGGTHYEFDPELLSCSHNTYKDFLNGTTKYYKFPYPDGTDVYISDVGVYFPSQYCNELNKLYPHFPVFFALSRHVGDSNVHVNCQALARCWDKIREQSSRYILCLSCNVIFKKLVIQRVRIYNKYDAAESKMRPFSVRLPLFASAMTRSNIRIARDQHEAAHGLIENRLLIYVNRSSYNTRIFKKILENSKKG